MNSREKIIRSFISLTKKRLTTEIPVKDICRDANISRKTFYNYFSDRQMVIEEIFVGSVEQTIKNCLKYGMSTRSFLIAVYNAFLEEKDFFAISIKDKGQNSLFDTMILRSSIIFESIFKDYITDEKRLKYLSYKFGADQAMLIRKWLTEGMKETPEFMADVYLTNYDEFECFHNEIAEKKHIW